MKNRGKFFSIFIVLIILSLIIFTLSKVGVLNQSSFLAKLFSPLSTTARNVLTANQSDLKEENIKLSKKIIDQNKIEKQNRALLDQFQTVYPVSADLIPAEVIGAPAFIPGVSLPEFLIINKGTSDGVKKGNAVVYQNNLVGRIFETTARVSKVRVITNPSSSFTAKTENNVNGVLNGQGEVELLFDNVLLSESIKKDEMILTKGDQDGQGIGFPPDLIVGKVISVEKNPSALFQKAEIKSLIDFSKLSTVFVLK